MSEDTAIIGIPVTSSETVNISYLGEYNIAELDYVFWNSDSFYQEFNDVFRNEYPGYHANYLNHLRNRVREKTSEFRKFVNDGGNLVIFTGNNSEKFYEDNLIYKDTILDIFSPVTKSGRKRTKAENIRVETIISKIYDNFRYGCTLSPKHEKSIIKVPKTGELISSYLKTNNGGIILAIPFPGSRNLDIPLIKLLIKEIKDDNNKKYQNIPSWTKNYLLKEEKLKISRNNEIRNEIEKLKEEITENKKDIAKHQKWKNLFSSHDKQLEAVAIEAFEALGFAVTPGPEAHCDIICRRNETIIAVEAKGLAKGAKPKNVTQCNRWISDVESALDHTLEESDSTIKKYIECLQRLGVEFPTASTAWNVKGLMLINSFRDTPLEERNNPSELSFHDEVIKQMKRHHICGITGVQLLNLVLVIQGSPDKELEIFQSITDATGQLTSHTDWDAFLSKEDLTIDD